MFKPRLKTKKNCSVCKKELLIRNDHLKTHKGMCTSCLEKLKWENIEFRKKHAQARIGCKTNPPLPYGEANFNGLFRCYSKSAQDRGVYFNLSKEQFKLLTKQDCYYCGIEPLQKFNNGQPEKWKYGLWIYNGIDRKDDSMGYEINNCVPCCMKCNYAKQGLSDVEFLEHIEKIHKNHLEKTRMGSRNETIS